MRYGLAKPVGLRLRLIPSILSENCLKYPGISSILCFMRRFLTQQLLEWKDRKRRIPLLLRGARQVGKSFAVQQLGEQHFKHFLTINFEKKPEYSKFFDDLDPKSILTKLETVTGQRIVPGVTLLFLDEIQVCPKAILSLRYFKEELPELHIIAAGSLIEFTLNEGSFSFPVGRVQPMYLHPLSFVEFLLALQKDILVEQIQNCSLESPFHEVIHEQLIELLKQYLLVGGMPEAVQTFIDTNSILECQRVQSHILETYQADFAKYSTKTTHRYLNTFFDKAPGVIGTQFKYTHIDANAQSRDLKTTLEQLTWAGLIRCIYATSASGIPLHAQAKFNQFKLLFLDIGLMQRALRLDVQTVWENDLLQINAGQLAEQLVGQELIAYENPYEQPRLHYWHREERTSTAEVDYVIQIKTRILPVEVKAGRTGRLKSLQVFLEEKKAPLGVRISQKALELEKNILSVPFYLISSLSAIIKQTAEQSNSNRPK